MTYVAVITAVHSMIVYQATKIFTWFEEEMAEARRTGDVGKSKALLAEVFKLLGNSGYRKLTKALERQMCVVYPKDKKVLDSALRKAYFSDLQELGQAYQLGSRSFVAQSIDRSRSQSQFNSWQANARVLLRFLGSVHRPPRLQADSDEHDLCLSA